MFKKIRIRKHEVGLWFRHGDFKYVMNPGAYLVPFRVFGDKIEVVNKLNTKFDHSLFDVIVDEEQLASKLLIVDLKDNERALIWKDGRLGWVLGPGRHAFWRDPYKLEVERFDVTDVKFDHPKIETILGHPGGSKFLDGVRVEAHERVLLFLEGKLMDQLDPGMYVFWKNVGKILWKAVDLREQVADVAGQEIMSADKVTLRINLVVTYRVTDAEAAIMRVNDYAQTLYREVQLALREAVGTRTLDKLLADKDTVGNEIRNALASRAVEFGVSVRSVGLRDIILPGDMKVILNEVILNEVILAQKQAEANLIRRREEAAAARSQANTAKLLADNPTLARMKELEALQEILKGAKATFVLGQGDIVDQVRSLVGKDVQNAGASGD